MLIYDVGMHRGEDTAFYLRKGFKVIGFEADPNLIEHCRIRFVDAISTGQLHIIEGAISPSAVGGKVKFFQNPDMSVWGTIDPNWASRNAKLGYESTVIFLDRVDIADSYRNYGTPYYLKVDVEGVDKIVLEALQNFDEKPQYVSMESEKVDLLALEGELMLLRRLGYSKFKIVQQGDIPGRKINTKTLDGEDLEYHFERDASGPFGEDIEQPWLTYDETIREYRYIFRRYRLFGDGSFFNKLPPVLQGGVGVLYKFFSGYRGSLPGWFDTHASL